MEITWAGEEGGSMLLQCKAVARLPLWLQTSENVDATLIRVDGHRGKPVEHKALIDLSLLLSLLQTAQEMDDLLRGVEEEVP